MPACLACEGEEGYDKRDPVIESSHTSARRVDERMQAPAISAIPHHLSSLHAGVVDN